MNSDYVMILFTDELGRKMVAVAIGLHQVETLELSGLKVIAL